MNAASKPKNIHTATLLGGLLLSLGTTQAQALSQPQIQPIKEVGARSGFTQDNDADGNGHALASADIGYFHGWARADLAAGKLKALAATSLTQGNGCTPGETGCYWGSQSRAFFIDTVTFHRTGAPGQTTTIDWHFDIDGTKDLGPFNGQITALGYGYVGDSTEAMGATNAVNLGDFNRIGGTVSFDTDEHTVYIFGAIDLMARNGATADYSHTMSFEWTLPENVSYTSQSGTFLTATSAVPEPQSAALSLVGLCVMGLVVNQRRRRA